MDTTSCLIDVFLPQKIMEPAFESYLIFTFIKSCNTLVFIRLFRVCFYKSIRSNLNSAIKQNSYLLYSLSVSITFSMNLTNFLNNLKNCNFWLLSIQELLQTIIYHDWGALWSDKNFNKWKIKYILVLHN